MKLGSLVVLAVAVLVPSLSESRNISRCELKEKLGESLVLPKRFQKFEDTILKVVICNLEQRTHLETDRIRVFGHPRKTTTTTRPVTTKPLTTKPLTTTPVPIRPVTTTTVPIGPVNTTTVPTRPVTTKPVTTKPTTTESTTAKPTTTESNATNPVTTKPTTTESATAKPTTTESVGTNPAATSSTSAGTTRSNQTTPGPGSNRRKREANATSDESDSENTGGTLQEMLNEEQVKFDEEQLWQDDNKMELEDGGKRNKRSWRRGRGRGRKVKPWSLGIYGIFGLTDSHFCDSGYRWSRNLCNTSCNAFTDEDISDDCDCAVKTHYWLPLFWSAPRKCRRVSVQKFFRDCD